MKETWSKIETVRFRFDGKAKSASWEQEVGSGGCFLMMMLKMMKLLDLRHALKIGILKELKMWQ